MSSKAARTREVVLAQLQVHERQDTLPTTARFLFYELEAQGLATKPTPGDTRPNRRRNVGWPPGSQDITDALRWLRDEGIIPWTWVTDTERTAVIFAHAATVLGYVRERLGEATVNPWDGPPPLVLCEDKGTAEALMRVVSGYACPIAGLKGHCNGFLRTEIAGLLEGGGADRLIVVGAGCERLDNGGAGDSVGAVSLSL
jgi:hypothetical protein